MPAQLSLVFDTTEARKARGAFFTPEELAAFLATWAVRTPKDRILEPSCGEASLLAAAGRRLRALGGRTKLIGLDVHAPSLDAARDLLRGEGLTADLRRADFFDETPVRRFDVVIGNPPYIRYQSFSGKERTKAQRAALAQGVRLSGLANAWAAFVLHAAAFLRPTGRLALVLPAVLLSVNYAAPVRRFLLETFASVKLVMFEQRVFPDVQEEVVLLLAEGKGSTSQFDLYQVRDLDGLAAIARATVTSRPWTPTDADDKWTEALIPADASTLYTDLTEGSSFNVLGDWGDTDLGMVTGNNHFFTLSSSEVRKLGLATNEVKRISPPGSRHLRGLTFSDATFEEMAAEGSRVYLFYPDKHRPSKAAKRYIAHGEERGIDKAYKCSNREPWWRVPTLRIPDLFLTYMNQDVPRLVHNDAKAAHLNSIHGVTLQPGTHHDLGADLLPLAMLNSVTLLGAELVGRSYGGGILKIEPKEADRLPMPAPATLEAAAPTLRAMRPQLARRLRSNLDEVVKAVDAALLVGTLKRPPEDVAVLLEARNMMAARRAARAGKPK